MDGFYLPWRQQMFIIAVGVLILFLVIELIRKHQLLEQYSVIWLLLAIFSISIVWIYPAVVWLTRLIDAGNTSSVILFFGIFTSLMLNMQLCIKISEHSQKIKNLIQENALLNHELEKLRDHTRDKVTDQT